MIVALVGIVGIHGLIPWSDQAFIIERSHLVHPAQSLIGLTATGIIVTVQEPKELSAHAVAGTFGQFHFLQQQGCMGFFAIAFVRMIAQRAPSTVLAIKKLVGLLQFVGIVVNIATIGAAPVLHHVPIGAFTTVAGGDQTLRATGGIHVSDNLCTFFGKVLRQRTLILQSPENVRRIVAPLLHPLDEMALERTAELARIVPDMG